MSRRFRVENKDFDKKDLIITLHKPPYENSNILEHTGWKENECTIIELKQYRIEE